MYSIQTISYHVMNSIYKRLRLKYEIYFHINIILLIQKVVQLKQILFVNLCGEIVRKEKRENKFQVEISLTDKTFRSICV